MLAHFVIEGRELLAVAAPRGVELDDGVLAGLEHRGVEVVAAEDGHLRGGDAQAEREEQREGLHHRAIGKVSWTRGFCWRRL